MASLENIILETLTDLSLAQLEVVERWMFCVQMNFLLNEMEIPSILTTMMEVIQAMVDNTEMID